MSIISIEEVSKTGLDPALFLGGNLDIPASGTLTDYYRLEIAGWWVAVDDRPVTVEILYQGSIQAETAPNVARSDVTAHFAPRPIPEKNGFSLTINTTHLSPRFELAVELTFAEGSRLRWATIRGRQQPLAPAFRPELQPIVLYGPSRSGSTWLMQLMGLHPEIVIDRHFPYEVRNSTYWLHQARVLSEPATFEYNAQTEFEYYANTELVHRNLHNKYPFIDQPSIREWYGREHTNDLFAFSLQSIEKFYRQVALDQAKPAVRFFAEKFFVGSGIDWVPQITSELYAKPKEIFFVRDFRDQFCSFRSFNLKRGLDLAAIYDGKTVEEYLIYERRKLDTLWQNWQHRQARAFLLHYEDLVLQPQETLAAIYRYLEVDHSPALVEKILVQGAVETPETQRHKTTASPDSSIGRWKTDLDAHLQAVINDRLGESLTAFGYKI